MSFTEIPTTKFELKTITWGVDKNKFGGYFIPIKLGQDDVSKIESLAEEHGTKNPLYGETLYLKSKALTEKQTKELYKKGRRSVNVVFDTTGVYTNTNTYVRHLVFKVRKLGMVDED